MIKNRSMGFLELLLLSIMKRTVAEPNISRPSLPVPLHLAGACAREGKTEHGGEAVLNTQGSSPPQMLVWGEGLRGQDLCSAEPHCRTGPGTRGSSSPTPGKGPLGGRSPVRQRGPGSRDPSLRVGEEQGEPCRRPNAARAGPGVPPLQAIPLASCRLTCCCSRAEH